MSSNPFSCDAACECGNNPDNWSHCSAAGCGAMTCDLGANAEPDWSYDDSTEAWLCPSCSSASEKCAVCDAEFVLDRIVGACEPGPRLGNVACEKLVEAMCHNCGAWDAEDEVWRCPSCARALAAAPQAPPSAIEGLIWARRFAAAPHEGCLEEGCPGQQCQFNALCGSCSCVLGVRVTIYCLERGGSGLTVCGECYEEMAGAMREEGGWAVDGEELNEAEAEEEEEEA